jgi:hypothetical protein
MPIFTFQPGSLHSPWELQPQRFVDTWLKFLEWSVDIALGAAYLDSRSKSDAYRIGAKHVTGFNQARPYEWSFPVHRWRVIHVLCRWSSNKVSRFLGWCWRNWAILTFPSENYTQDFLSWYRGIKIPILPEGQRMNSTYFINCVLRPLTEFCYPQGREILERRVMV